MVKGKRGYCLQEREEFIRLNEKYGGRPYMFKDETPKENKEVKSLLGMYLCIAQHSSNYTLGMMDEYSQRIQEYDGILGESKKHNDVQGGKVSSHGPQKSEEEVKMEKRAKILEDLTWRQNYQVKPILRTVSFALNLGTELFSSCADPIGKGCEDILTEKVKTGLHYDTVRRVRAYDRAAAHPQEFKESEREKINNDRPLDSFWDICIKTAIANHSTVNIPKLSDAEIVVLTEVYERNRCDMYHIDNNRMENAYNAICAMCGHKTLSYAYIDHLGIDEFFKTEKSGWITSRYKDALEDTDDPKYAKARIKKIVRLGESWARPSLQNLIKNIDTDTETFFRKYYEMENKNTGEQRKAHTRTSVFYKARKRIEEKITSEAVL